MADTFEVTIRLPRKVTVPVTKGSGVVNEVPLSEFTPGVIEEAALAGFMGALNNISGGATKAGFLPSNLQAQREKRIDVWRGGDFRARTVEVDPLPRQMFEIVVGRLLDASKGKLTRKAAEAKVGGPTKLEEFARRIKGEKANEWFESIRAEAEALIAARREAVADLNDDDLGDLL